MDFCHLGIIQIADGGCKGGQNDFRINVLKVEFIILSLTKNNFVG
jgi:hypothetical protein